MAGYMPMAGCTGEHPQVRRRRAHSPIALIVLCCCAVVSMNGPSAAAKPDRGGGTNEAGPPTHQGSPPFEKHQSSPTPAHGNRPEPSAEPGSGHSHGSGASPVSATPPQGRGHGHGRFAQGGSEGVGAGRTGSPKEPHGKAKETGPSEAHGKATGTSVGEAHGKARGEGATEAHGKARAQVTAKTGVARSAVPPASAPTPANLSPAPSIASPPSNLSSATGLSTTPPTAAGSGATPLAPTSGSPGSPVSGNGAHPQRVRGAHGGGSRRLRHGTVKSSPAGAPRGGAGIGPLLGLLSVPVQAPQAPLDRVPRRSPSSRHRTPSAHLGPLVRTITKIVGVVPLPIRIVIAGLLLVALGLGLRSRLTAVRARKLERQRGQLLEDVGLLQGALLPVPPARLGPVGTSAAYRPADGPGAGGDFYDVFALASGSLGVIVGDVSGHGRRALPHTALLRFTLRAYLEAGLSPRETLRTGGEVLERQLGESFATVVVATYQPRERVLTYACAGHPPPLVLGGGSSVVPITACSSPPISSGMRTGARQTVVSLPGAALVCFHTDGVTEARVGSELFGTERLERALTSFESDPAAGELLERVAEQTDARPDDMAACLLSIEGGPDPPQVLSEQLELDREEAFGRRIEQFLLACGVGVEQIPELVRSARAEVERSGVVLEAQFDGGAPRVGLRADNVASLHTAHARRTASLGAAR